MDTSSRHRPASTAARRIVQALPWLVAGAGLSSGCAATAASPLTAPPSMEARDALIRPIQPGREVPRSRIVLPAQARPGEIIDTQVPPGSSIEAFGAHLLAGEDGRVLLRVPQQAGRYPVRIQRPDVRRPLLLHVTVASD